MLLNVVATEAGPPLDVLLTVFTESAPRVAVDASCVWLDVRGLDAEAVCDSVRRRLKAAGVCARYGAGPRPILAAVAARSAAVDQLVQVPRGGGRDFLASQSLVLLGLEDPLLGWLADVGIGTCGELAAIEREAVEVRFGAAAVGWWRLARADDERRLFAPIPPQQPNASVDFIDYVVTDPERLIFTTNALLAGVCDRMRERGAHARRLRLRLPLANGSTWERTLKAARPTADRSAWLRLARTLLEKLTVPDAVSGVSVEVEATESAAAVQGDLFDTGFATAGAVETALARLLEDQGDVMLEPTVSGHPLAEQRGSHRPLTMREVLNATEAVRVAEATGSESVAEGAGSGLVAERTGSGSVAVAREPVGLTLQLLPEPRAITVETVPRRDHAAPVRYRDGTWQPIVHAAGPDRVSGGQWDATYAREYYRAVTAAGTLVWIFRDAGRDRWYLHGWWD